MVENVKEGMLGGEGVEKRGQVWAGICYDEAQTGRHGEDEA